jgi:hypothetical protein
MMPLRNPYHDKDGAPQIQQSIVAYLDILGFSEEMREHSRAGTQRVHLEQLRQALSKARQPFRTTDYYAERFGSSEAPYKLKVFTDNVVLGIPIWEDGESDLGQMISLVGEYQLILALHGFFVRGGISVGELYMDEDVVYGNGLLEAHQAEVSLARDPRIVLDQRAMEMVHQHLTYYGLVEDAPHNNELAVDSDGQMFINYLVSPLDGSPPDENYLKQVELHRDLVCSRLAKYQDQPLIWSKYAWAATYHNVVCSDFFDTPSLIVDPKFLQRPAQKLSSIYKKVGADLYIGSQAIAKWKSLVSQPKK